MSVEAPGGRHRPEDGILYVVGTPIGNLDDLGARARDVLARCALVACEDTRTTRGLLARIGVRARLVSCHQFNERARLAGLLEVLDRGGSVALVTDSGTPGLSDPGALLVRGARDAGHRVVPVPGPSAVTALLSVSGFPLGAFTFVGFLPPRAGERRRALETLRSSPVPLLFFEAPHRLLAMLHDVIAILGDRQAILGREMTKLHEEFVAGRLGVIRAAFEDREVRGEIALLVAGADAAAESAPEPPAEPVEAAVARLEAAGLGRKEAMRRVARQRGLSRRDVYRVLLAGRRRPAGGADR
jgi:16S rRNA (cytidine1402-2'-O)-methyltransferase